MVKALHVCIVERKQVWLEARDRDKMSTREAQRGQTMQGRKEQHRELVEFLFFQALKGLSRSPTSLGYLFFKIPFWKGEPQ